MRKGLQMSDAPTIPIALSLLQLETGQFDDALRLARMASLVVLNNPIKRDFLIQALEIVGWEREAAEAAARGSARMA